FLHEGIPAMAAAYAFHICKNHPFVDGNKRAATAAMIAFLSDNGWKFEATADEAEPVILQLAAGSLEKTAFTDWPRKQRNEQPGMELREVVSRSDAAQVTQRFLSLRPGETGVSPTEFAQGHVAVAPAMPFMLDLERQQKEAKQAGDALGYDEGAMFRL